MLIDIRCAIFGGSFSQLSLGGSSSSSSSVDINHRPVSRLSDTVTHEQWMSTESAIVNAKPTMIEPDEKSTKDEDEEILSSSSTE